MSFPVFNFPEDVCGALRQAIEAAIADAKVEVIPSSPRHFEITVMSQTFEGESMVQQQQRVYRAIKHLMEGEHPPLHAIDRLQTLVS